MKITNDRCLSKDQIKSLLKEVGLSVTAQRVGLCHYVLCEARHPTVDDIRHWAANNGIKTSLATVYNTLHALCDAGLLKDLRFPHMDKVIYDNNVEPHQHFLDEESGQIIDLHNENFEFETKLSDDYEVHNVDILIRGKLKKQR